MAHAGHTIRTQRKALGLSLRDLASISGVSYAHLSLVERGERTPTDRWLREVADGLATAIAEQSGDAA